MTRKGFSLLDLVLIWIFIIALVALVPPKPSQQKAVLKPKSSAIIGELRGINNLPGEANAIKLHAHNP